MSICIRGVLALLLGAALLSAAVARVPAARTA